MRLANLYVRFRRLVERLSKITDRVLTRKKTVYVWERVSYYKEMWKSAADRNGFNFDELTNDLWEISDRRGSKTRIHNWCVELDDPVTLYLAGNKTVTYRLLEEAGLPVPSYVEFTLDELTPMMRFVEQRPGPFVVKPAIGTGAGIGISTHLYTARDCLRAAALASLYGQNLLIEQFVAGEVYRFLFVRGRFVGAVCRRGVWVTGDGHSSLEQLVGRKYKEDSQFGRYRGWEADMDLVATTAAQGLAPNFVPRLGADVLVKSVAADYPTNVDVRTVYTADVTNEVASALVDEARAAAAVLRSDFCAVDMIAIGCARSLKDTLGVIGEINTTPGLHHHYDLLTPDRGDQTVDAVLAVLMGRDEATPAGTR